MLHSPDAPPEQLLEIIAYRRGDGREIRLGELSLSDEFRNAETVRAEEIKISVPDGRSVTVLVNATPIHSADGAVVSLVVTMQDLAPLEELERLWAEFLGMVGHELRTPLTSIKGSATTALGTEPELDPAEMREFFRIIDEQADHMRGLIGDLLDVGRIDSGTLSVPAREPVLVAQPLENPVRRVPLLARHLRIGVRLQDRVDDAGEPVQLRPPHRLPPPVVVKRGKLTPYRG